MTVAPIIKMRQDAYKLMRVAHQRYKEDHNGRASSELKKIKFEQYASLGRSPMNTSTVECLATELYSKILSIKTVPSQEIEVSPTTVTNNEDGIRNTVLVHRATGAPAAKQAPIKNNNMKKDQTDAELEKTTQVTRDWKRRIALTSCENTPCMA